jgi:predicted transcriptional regulator
MQKKTRSLWVTFRLSENEKQKLQEISRKEDMSISCLIRRTVKSQLLGVESGRAEQTYS